MNDRTPNLVDWLLDKHRALKAVGDDVRADAIRFVAEAALDGEMKELELTAPFKRGERVTKKSGSSWTGRVVGFYSTELNPVGICVESETEKGSVQIYPAKALKSFDAS